MFVIGSIVPSLFSDRIGRRIPMMVGSFGLGLSMMLISILLSFKGTSEQKSTSAASVAFFFTYMLIFGASVNCIPWVYVPEILPLHARAKGTAVGISSNWIWVSSLLEPRQGDPTLTFVELLCRHDNANHNYKPTVEGLSDLHVYKFCLHTSGLFLLPGDNESDA